MKYPLSAIKNTQPRREHGDIAGLKASIREVGLICSLTINQNYELLAGRRRYQALLELYGPDYEVECHIINTDFDGIVTLDLDKVENKCELCDFPFADSHHILPLEYGGIDDTANQIYLCSNHHRAIHFLIQLDLAMAKNEAKLMPKNGLDIQKFLILNDQKLYHFYNDYLRGRIHDEAIRAAATRTQDSAG